MFIPFTQYSLPDGKKSSVAYQTENEEVEAKAVAIITAGFTLECEILTTDEVSFTITDDEEGDVAIEVCSNGPDVIEAVERLILNFNLVKGAL